MGQFKWKHAVSIIVAVIGVIAAFFAGQSVQQQQVVNVFVDKTGTEDYNTTIEKVQEKLQEGEQSADENQQTIDELNITISALNKDLENCKSEYESQLNALKEENKSYENQVDALKQENESYKNQNADLIVKNDSLVTQVSSLSDENNNLRKLCLDNNINPDDIERSQVHSGNGVALTELTDLEKNKSDYIKTGPDAATKDDAGKNYSYGISSMGVNEDSVEYRIDGKYKYLSGTLFVTAYGAGSYEGNRWDKMSFTIYADDKEIFPGDTYEKPAYGKQMEAIKITDLSIEGATRIKFVFYSAVNDSWGEPLICFGTPRVYSE